ncbi:hypothetical protein DNTS_011672 [Danionella cerebrum]|uniref:DUF4524 domain-containing protein n=1 Tax=Danionella cerebrum TaxID=2873325 RepID=A0A553P175_9TELE|nr:hypothetical protein DNTS_011672 [Danionella translucida]
MSAVRFMVMSVDEGVEVFYTDGRRLQLSACGSEFMLEKPPSAHPLQARERVKQRSRFAISEYKTLVSEALAFRNKFATHPYLPEELVDVDSSKPTSSAVAELQWSGVESCSSDSDGETTVCSEEGQAKLVLSSSGQEFMVEFLSQTSRNDTESHNAQLQGHKSTCLLNLIKLDPSSKSAKSCSSDKQAPSSDRSGGLRVCTSVVQQFSRALYPKIWSYALSLAIKHQECLKTQASATNESNREGARDAEDGGRSQTKQKTLLPKPLPLTCPSPHQHKWRCAVLNPELFGQEEEVKAELVKVVWCKGITYRIIDGGIPTVEISPGDGSLIRSNGVEDCVYYLCGLPPDVPGQLYSIQSVVTRASRILKSFMEARGSVRATPTLSCWNQTVLCDCARVVQEVSVPGTGEFKAHSDGTVEVLFMDGVKAQMTWSSEAYAPAQCGEMEQKPRADPGASHRWCQLSFSDGHQTLVGDFRAGENQEIELPHLPSSMRSLPSQKTPESASGMEITETFVSKALQKTSRAIQEIDWLLSDRT